VHHHTSCEIHLIISGTQVYQVQGKVYTVPTGHYILIPAGISHQHISSAPDTHKYSITFSRNEGQSSSLAEHLDSSVLCRPVPPAAQEALRCIEAESISHKEYSLALMECNIFRFLLHLARDAGLREEHIAISTGEDPRLSIARQYIMDNIDRPITCQELADYIHLSEKQLSRLFLQFTGKNPAAYIRSQKILRIEHLLAETDLSLKSISDRMHFSSECHFSSFFTKYAGLTPGAYRKMTH
jgi:AraC-like DNA-binding protein